MDLFRRAANPWGQDVFLGISWDLMWAAAIAGLAFVVFHAVWSKRRAGPTGPTPASGAGEGSGRVVRHTLASRLFHWVMATSMIVLLVTAFFPVIGIQFDWVTLHWIAGLVLLAAVVYHMVHSTVVRNWKTIWFDRGEIRAGTDELRHFMTGEGEEPARTGKYATANKAFHHAAALTGIGTIVTGLLMMVRIDTPLWARNPYLLGDATWGLVYVVHGLCGVALITLTAAHVYFAVRPDKLWLTRSMIKGWITREEYLAHHDPAKWSPDAAPDEEGVTASAPVDPAPAA